MVDVHLQLYMSKAIFRSCGPTEKWVLMMEYENCTVWRTIKMFKLSLVLIVSEISSESHAISSLCWIATFASYVGRPDAALWSEGQFFASCWIHSARIDIYQRKRRFLVMYQQIWPDFPLFSMIVRVLAFAAKLAPTQRTIYWRLIHWLEVISYPVLQRVINHIKWSQLGWNGIHQLVGVLFSAKQFHKLHCLYLSSMLQPVDLVRH